MKVKVIKSKPDNWYKVGEEYDVQETVSFTLEGEKMHRVLGATHTGIGPEDFVVIGKEEFVEVPASIDSHYNFNYSLSPEDIDNGYIKLDPYFVAKQWKLGSKDDTGILFHCFKLIARFGDKNPKEREILALYKQAVRLAELEGVELK